MNERRRSGLSRVYSGKGLLDCVCVSVCLSRLTWKRPLADFEGRKQGEVA